MELTLKLNSDHDVIAHFLPFGLRPAVFLPGQFEASVVGGVHPLELHHYHLGVIHTQVRIFWIAPVGVIDPFVPGIGVSLVLDHVDLFDQFEILTKSNPKITGSSLLQCGLEEVHDRFSLSSRLY